MDTILDQKAIKRRYHAHLDRWLAGKERLMTPVEFLAHEVAEAIAQKLMAERGLLAA